MGRSWRLWKRSRTGGVYSSLQSGKGHERRTLALKYVTAVEAERALECMQREEDEGTIARVFALHREKPDEAIR